MRIASLIPTSAVALGVAIFAGCDKAGPAAATMYRTAPVARTDIVRAVSATGTVTPCNTASGIPVGAQVNGKIIKLYVDYNDVVTNGQAVAEIDPLVYQAEYDSCVARLGVNRAGVEEAKCALSSRQAELILAEKTYNRKKTLVEKNMAPVSDLDSATETYEKAKLAVESAKASLASANANVTASEASVRQAEANLGYCTIRSPVNGVVLARKVEFGETVVSSMNAVPVLTIAEDLNTVWISADIPEADIGNVKVGQIVTFTVDAYKQGSRLRTFTGKVKQVRKASTTTNNVVTFPVIVEAENPGQVLFPGMTATISIETARADDTIAVAAAAFRFRPKDEDRARIQGEIPRGRKLWLKPLKDGDPLEYVMVDEGVTDDSFTQILCDAVEKYEGREAVVGYETATSLAQKDGQSNPFMPKFPKHNKNKGTAPEKKK